MNYNELWNDFSSSLFAHVKNLIKKAPYDKTFKAKVLGKISDDKYLILYKNIKYTASSNGAVNTGDIVHVCAPGNNWSELFILESSKGSIDVTSTIKIITAEEIASICK